MTPIRLLGTALPPLLALAAAAQMSAAQTSAPPTSPPPAAGQPKVAQAPAALPFTLRVAGRDVAPAPAGELGKRQSCPAGSPDGNWRLTLTPSPGEDGNDWTTIEIEDAKGASRQKVDRVYRLSGPCWAPDGSYFVYGEGGVVKISAPGRSPFVLYQETESARGGIFPAQVRNFRWGTGMGSLSFLMVDDPRKEEPDAHLVTLVVK